MGQPVPVIFANAGQRKAASRLLSNEKITMEDGLVSIGGAGKGGVGVVVHTSLVVNEAGRPLGVLDLDGRFQKSEYECMPDEPKESERWLRGLQRSAQLGEVCPNTQVVNVCDREGDIWEMFQRQSELQSTDLLVRANRSRKRKVVHPDGSEEDLQRYMEQLPVTTKCEVELVARGGEQACSRRKVKLQVRVAAVQLLAPGSSGTSLPVVVVLAQEYRHHRTVHHFAGCCYVRRAKRQQKMRYALCIGIVGVVGLLKSFFAFSKVAHALKSVGLMRSKIC